ncbi:MAG: PPC domain-containing DNA-binding protein [Bacillota bacterium]
MPATDMHVFSGKTSGRVAVARLTQGSDLLDEINSLAERTGFAAATVQFIGALRKAVVLILDQDTKEYISRDIPGPLEIVAGSGNISLRDGKPFAHVHIVVSGLDGKCFGGHVANGCEVYLTELVLTELSMDKPLERTLDKEVGVAVWQ